MKDNTVRLNEKDNVLVVIKEIKAGDEIINHNQFVTHAATDIPYGHKIAICDINVNDAIIKFGEVIGYASINIKNGEWVHTHNLGYEEGKV
ncbi:MAG: UxaA family hydrolase [Caldicoprobacterales bacterium]|jgi:altronate dehydratase